jgi:hypothetical protein
MKSIEILIPVPILCNGVMTRIVFAVLAVPIHVFASITVFPAVRRATVRAIWKRVAVVIKPVLASGVIPLVVNANVSAGRSGKSTVTARLTLKRVALAMRVLAALAVNVVASAEVNGKSIATGLTT